MSGVSDSKLMQPKLPEQRSFASLGSMASSATLPWPASVESFGPESAKFAKLAERSGMFRTAARAAPHFQSAGAPYSANAPTASMSSTAPPPLLAPVTLRRFPIMLPTPNMVPNAHAPNMVLNTHAPNMVPNAHAPNMVLNAHAPNMVPNTNAPCAPIDAPLAPILAPNIVPNVNAPCAPIDAPLAPILASNMAPYVNAPCAPMGAPLASSRDDAHDVLSTGGSVEDMIAPTEGVVQKPTEGVFRAPTGLLPTCVPRSMSHSIKYATSQDRNLAIRHMQSAPIQSAPFQYMQSVPIQVAPSQNMQSVPIQVAPSQYMHSVPIQVAPSQYMQTGQIQPAPSQYMQSAPIESAPSQYMQSAPIESAPSQLNSVPARNTAPWLWAYDKPQLVNLHVMYLADLPKPDAWMSSLQYVVSVHSGSSPSKPAAPPRLLPTFDPKETTSLPVVTKPANVFDSASMESLSREDKLQTQVFTHLSDLRLSKKCVAEEGEKCFFDEKFQIMLPTFEDVSVVNIWRLSTTYLTAKKKYSLYGQVYLPLNEPKWNKKVCTWPLVDPDSVGKDVIGTATFLFSLASTPEPCPKLSVVSVGKRSVSLAWEEPASDNGSPIKGYRVQYRKFGHHLAKPTRKGYGDSSGKPQAGDEYEWQTVANCLNETEFVVEHLTGNTQFIFRVSAQNMVGCGDAIESSVIVTGPMAPSAPGKPRLVGRSPDGVSQAFLEWDASEDDNGASITAHRMWTKTVGSHRWVDVGEINAGSTTVPTDDSVGEKVVYRAKITSLPTSGRVVVSCAAINEVGVGPSSEEDSSLAFEWIGDAWERDAVTTPSEPPIREVSASRGVVTMPKTAIGEISLPDKQPESNCRSRDTIETAQRLTTSDVSEPSASQVRREQDQDYQISLMHDEVQELKMEEDALTLRVSQFRDELDEQESLAKMARQRMETWGADNPNISKALVDATSKVTELTEKVHIASDALRETSALLLDRRAIIQAFET